MRPSSDRLVGLNQRQHALVGQWQALGYLLLFIGLFLGTAMTWGSDGPALMSVGLVVGMAMLAPLALITLSAWLGRYRLASVLGMLGALYYASFVPLLVGAFDGYLLQLQILPILLLFVPLLGLLASAVVATFSAAHALWGAVDRSRQLGPRRRHP
jgi:hypothetical protein